MTVPVAVIPVGVSVGVSAPVLSSIRLGRIGASPRAEWMSGLSVIILRSDFAMLEGGVKEREREERISHDHL
jgi:hypothetical protein